MSLFPFEQYTCGDRDLILAKLADHKAQTLTAFTDSKDPAQAIYRAYIRAAHGLSADDGLLTIGTALRLVRSQLVSMAVEQPKNKALADVLATRIHERPSVAVGGRVSLRATEGVITERVLDPDLSPYPIYGVTWGGGTEAEPIALAELESEDRGYHLHLNP